MTITRVGQVQGYAGIRCRCTLHHLLGLSFTDQMPQAQQSGHCLQSLPHLPQETSRCLAGWSRYASQCRHQLYPFRSTLYCPQYTKWLFCLEAGRSPCISQCRSLEGGLVSRYLMTLNDIVTGRGWSTSAQCEAAFPCRSQWQSRYSLT